MLKGRIENVTFQPINLNPPQVNDPPLTQNPPNFKVTEYAEGEGKTEVGQPYKSLKLSVDRFIGILFQLEFISLSMIL